ncbi:hypothetical protein AGMMS50233_09660 [Endomicrobiia bacterium]|nr:hypothetical protein AGMMS50233_09660 [Endomicrobiia bacterium]
MAGQILELELAKLSLMSSLEAAAAKKCHKPSGYARRFWSHFLGKDGAIISCEWDLPMLSLIAAKDLTNTTKDCFVEDNFTTLMMTSEKDKLSSLFPTCYRCNKVSIALRPPPQSSFFKSTAKYSSAVILLITCIA